MGRKKITNGFRLLKELPRHCHTGLTKEESSLPMAFTCLNLDNPVPDGYTGATPVKGFVLNTRADKELPPVYRILFEINQNWDWNEYWTNNKFPDDENYKMSCQPALVYEAVIHKDKAISSIAMKPIGHSHYSGKTGELFPDLSTLTTALYIADSIIVRVR